MREGRGGGGRYTHILIGTVQHGDRVERLTQEQCGILSREGPYLGVTLH